MNTLSNFFIRIRSKVQSFVNTDLPVASRRAKVILSNPEDSKTLAEVVRGMKKNECNRGDFTVTNETKEALDKEALVH